MKTIQMSEREIELIRSALTVKLMREVGKAQDVKKECIEKGIADGSQTYYAYCDEIRELIHKIDAI